MWPFKRTPSVTLDEAIANEPMPPCGEKHDHYYWKVQGYACPHCAAKEKEEQKMRDEDRQADKIAVRVAEILARMAKEE